MQFNYDMQHQLITYVSAEPARQALWIQQQLVGPNQHRGLKEVIYFEQVQHLLGATE